MARWWTRSQQRKYREERRKQASLVADRLLGKKTIDPDINAFHSYLDSYLYNTAYNMQVPNPRSNIIITGLSI